MSGTAGHIFLSHGSDDRAEANALTDFLEGRGLRIWIAPRDVRPGVDYSEALQEAIEGCAAFLVLVTDKANRSPYVRVETEMAFSLEKPIFPVRNSDLKPGPGLALFLKIRHWTDAFGPQREESLERLANELRSIAGVTEGERPAPVAAAAPPVAPPVAPRTAGPGHGLAIAGIAGLILLVLAGLWFMTRGGPAPAPAPVAPTGNASAPAPAADNVVQPEAPANQAAPTGEEYYTPPEGQAEPPPQQQQPQQQDPPTEGFYDPPQ